MVTGIVVGALSAAVLIQPTDTLVQAAGASRLEVESLQGQVVVRTWDRDAVRIRAEHSEELAVEIERSGSTISVSPEMEKRRDFDFSIDFDITMPRGFDLSVEGVAVDVDVEGAGGEVDVGTVHGSIRVVGGRGAIVVGSVNGTIHVEGAQGDLEVTGVAGGVTIRNCSGDVFAESVGGTLTLEGIDSSDVEVGTVGGSLSFDGTIQDGGSYSFGSHGGEIRLYLPANLNAEVEVMTFAGEIEVDYPGAPTEATAAEGIPGLNQKELTFELGTGSAQIEVETFGGTVHILRRGG
ncbi:MAG: DUF4097 domain-containing protein [Gemmatimonadetes bacterium]|nr:DUF4097 domain-containing protein [Gemmatimonadota bacterium]